MSVLAQESKIAEKMCIYTNSHANKQQEPDILSKQGLWCVLFSFNFCRFHLMLDTLLLLCHKLFLLNVYIVLFYVCLLYYLLSSVYYSRINAFQPSLIHTISPLPSRPPSSSPLQPVCHAAVAWGNQMGGDCDLVLANRRTVEAASDLVSANGETAASPIGNSRRVPEPCASLMLGAREADRDTERGGKQTNHADFMGFHEVCLL